MVTKAQLEEILADLRIAEDQSGDYLYALESATEAVAGLVEKFDDDTTELTVFLVGTDRDNARQSMLWIDHSDATEHADDLNGDDPEAEGKLYPYSVTARIDWSTVEYEG